MSRPGIVFGAALVLVCLSSVAWAAPVAPDAGLAAGTYQQPGWHPPSVPGIVWLQTQQLSAGKGLIYVTPFRSRLHVAHAARVIAANTVWYQRIQFFPNLVVLSGLYGNGHWLGYLQGSVTGTRGYISFLPYGGTECVDCP